MTKIGKCDQCGETNELVLIRLTDENGLCKKCAGYTGKSCAYCERAMTPDQECNGESGDLYCSPECLNNGERDIATNKREQRRPLHR